MGFSPEWPTSLRFRKRSDQVAEQIKTWIITHSMKPGDRLPQERDLTKLFRVSKGTTREALKALEVQGLIAVAPGPGGGAVIAEMPEERAVALIGNYFYFRTPTVKEIYDVRKILEPELAISAIDCLTEEHFARLKALIKKTSAQPQTADERRQQRSAELEFHDVLAEACPNVWLAFACRFMNRFLAEFVVFQKTYLLPQQDFARSNLNAHESLVEALERRDKPGIRRIMAEHMEQAAGHTLNLDGAVDRTLLLRSS